MSNFEILRRVTEPTTDAKVMDIVRARYGHIRDNIGSDDKVPVAAVKPARRGPSELTKSWANHFSNRQYSLEAVADLVAKVPAKNG